MTTTENPNNRAGLLSGLRRRWEDRRNRNALEALPMAIRRDIGWPALGDGNRHDICCR